MTKTITVLIALLAFTTLQSLSCRKVQKSSISTNSDSTSLSTRRVENKDSTVAGSVTKSDISELYEKWKETIISPTVVKDSAVTNNNIYPTTIIREYEKGQKQESKSDSSFYYNLQEAVFVAIDSLNRKIDQKVETKVVKPDPLATGVNLAVFVLLGLKLLESPLWGRLINRFIPISKPPAA
jgi:hypothetical protein